MSVWTSITNKGKEISQKAKIMSETSSLNNIVKGEECKIDFQYKAIGKLYYEKFGDDPSEEFAPACDAIKNSLEKIEQTKAEITRIQSRFKCPNCGTPFKHDSVYCAKCGTKLPEREEEKPKEEIPDGAKKCEGCGNLLPSDALFCNVCGKKCTESEVSDADKQLEAKDNTDNAEAVAAKAAPSETAPAEDIAEDVEEKPEKSCPKCGAPIYKGDLFCNECGTKI